MGGALILFSVIIPTLLWADLNNRYIWLVLFITLSFGLIGYVDDMYKVSGRKTGGMKARYKFGLQVLFTAFAGYLDWQHTYGGEWEFLITLKIILAIVLTILLAVIAGVDDPEKPEFDKKTLFYILAILLVTGLGFSGGELQYG